MISMYKKSRTLLLGGLLLAFAVGLTGCATAYVDAGPNPARVEVDLAAVTNDDEINKSGSAFGLRGYLRAFSVWRDLRGPYWSWGLYLVKDDGSLWDLKADSQQSRQFIEGYELKRSVTFAVPPGAQRVRLLVQSHMEFWTSSMRDGNDYEIINVSSYSEDFNLNLSPGGRRIIKRSFGTPGRTNTIRRNY